MSRLHQMIKILELQLQHSPSSEYSGFISLKIDWIDWCDLLAVQGTLESLLQYLCQGPKAQLPSLTSGGQA